MKYPLVGVAGQARNGKDELGHRLVCYLSGSSTKLWGRGSYAAAVKRVFVDCFGGDLAHVEEWKVKNEVPPDLDVAMRQALIRIGDGFRQIKSTIWIDLLAKSLEMPTVITDTRYVNELKWVCESGGYNILVVRPGYLNDEPNDSEAMMRLLADYASKHISSSASMKCQFVSLAEWTPPNSQQPPGWEYLHAVIYNDGNLDDVTRCVCEQLGPDVRYHFLNQMTGVSNES